MYAIKHSIPRHNHYAWRFSQDIPTNPIQHNQCARSPYNNHNKFTFNQTTRHRIHTTKQPSPSYTQSINRAHYTQSNNRAHHTLSVRKKPSSQHHIACHHGTNHLISSHDMLSHYKSSHHISSHNIIACYYNPFHPIQTHVDMTYMEFQSLIAFSCLNMHNPHITICTLCNHITNHITTGFIMSLLGSLTQWTGKENSKK